MDPLEVVRAEDLFYLVTMFALGGLGFLQISWSVQFRAFVDRRSRFAQTERYVMAVIGQLLCLLAFYPFVSYGYDNSTQALHNWWGSPVIGQIIVITSLLALISPILFVAVLVRIHRHPAPIRLSY